MNIALLIPVYNPDEGLLRLIQELRELGFYRIVVVDDGSDEDRMHVFSELARVCTVLTHAVNLGKGRALKTGFNHCCANFPDLQGVVTLDADGQHSPEDVKKVADVLNKDESGIVLGVRTFSTDVPWKSLLGNLITRWVFYFLVRRKVTDTQSGLRGIPARLLPKLIKLKGERYEYEMRMLMESRGLGCEITEVPISTIYTEGNRSSHFHPIVDSFIIYFLLLRFASSSMTASLVDTLVFYILIKAHLGIGMSVICARAVSSLVNFLLNRGYVFRSTGNVLLSLIQYYLLVILIGIMSYLSIVFLHTELGVNVILAKVLSETLLFLLSFLVQRDIIFVSNRP